MMAEQLEEVALRELNREFCNIGHFMLSRALEAAYRRGAADTIAVRDARQLGARPSPSIGARVRFRPTKARFYVEAEVTGRRTTGVKSRIGWLETRDDRGIERAVPPSSCTIVKRVTS